MKETLSTIAIVLYCVAMIVLALSPTPRPTTQPSAAPSTGASPTGAKPSVADPDAGLPTVASGAPTPQPTGGIGEPAFAWAPGHEPTPRPAGISGEATWWFSYGHGLYAALRPDLGTKGDLAIVCGGEPFHCLSLPVTTTCACLGPGSRRLIDLSRDAFESFADPSVGTIRVSLQIVKGGAP